MTYSEYRALVDRLDSTDSKAEEKSIKGRIVEVARGLLLDVLVPLYRKYGDDFVGDPDYSDSWGTYTLKDYCRTNVRFSYSSRWGRYDDWNIGITVPMKYLDEFKLAELEEELRNDMAERRQKRVEWLEECIKEYTKELEKARKELEKCGRGSHSED